MNTIQEDLLEINLRVCNNIWDIIDINQFPTGLTPRLVIPYGNDRKRISEQEARFLYCSVLQGTNYYYSVETPTKGKYMFSGVGSISARSDISLYYVESNSGNLIQQVNIELKAHNPEVKLIEKDIFKFITEKNLQPELEGNWFHLLENIDSNTILSLFSKFKQSCVQNALQCKSLSILFTFCVIDKHWACLKQFSWDISQGSFESYVNDFFNLGYSIESGKVIIKDYYGWTIHSK